MRKSILHSALLAAAAMTALNASAVNRLYVKDFAIQPGETKVVEVYLQNDDPVRAIEMLVTLPEGLNFAGEPARLTSRAQGHTASARLTSRGYRMLAYSTDNTAFSGTDGAVLELTVTANDDFASSGTITMSEIIIEGVDGQALVDQGTATGEAYVQLAMPVKE